MIDWKAVLIGLLLTLVFGYGFSLFLPLGNLIGFILATIYVGYRVGGGTRNGVTHGAIVGFIGGIISIILSLLQFSSKLEIIIGGELGLFTLILIIGIIILSIAGAIGGFIGAFKAPSKENTD